MKKLVNLAAVLVLMVTAIGMMGCKPTTGGENAGGSGSGNDSGNGGLTSGGNGGLTSGGTEAHVHSWSLTADTATYLAAGTGTYTCTCGETKTEATEMKSPAYQFTEKVVALTGDDNTGSNGTNSNYVLFGDWPQSEAAAEITYRTEPESNGYYVGSDGNYYTKITVVTKDENNCEYTAGDVKYFKVEPIKWRVLDTAYDYDGESGSETAKLLLAENILTSNVPYYEDKDNNRTINSNDVYPNNYEHSQIRAYLNGLTYQGQGGAVSEWNGKGFFQTAFTTAAQAEIKTTVVNNKKESTRDFHKGESLNLAEAEKYACENTNDKIFLLSEYEVTKYSTEKYDDKGEGNSRIRKTTAYAMANNLWQPTTTCGSGYWWLRSPEFSNNNFARLVSYIGYANDYGYVDDMSCGVVPALAISF